MTQPPTDTERLVEELRAHVRYEYMPAAARLAMDRAASSLTSKAGEIIAYFEALSSPMERGGGDKE